MDLFNILLAKTLAGGGGGGGGGGLDLIAEQNLGTIATTSTSFIDTGKVVQAGDVRPYSALLVVIATEKRENGYHIGTARIIWLNGENGNSVGARFVSPTINWFKNNDKIQVTAPSSTYGVLANSGTGSNDNLGIKISTCYNSTNTTTIDADYTARVYGIKLAEL